MKIRTIGVLSIASIATSLAPVWAGPVGLRPSPNRRIAVISQLEAKQEQVSRAAAAPNAKGPLLVNYMDKSVQLQDLINRIQSGQSVSPDEIDRALQPANP